MNSIIKFSDSAKYGLDSLEEWGLQANAAGTKVSKTHTEHVPSELPVP